MPEKRDDMMKFLILTITMLVALFGVTYGLLIDRMNKQETIAAADITALREEIKTTKADAKDAVNAAAVASKDAVSATASALRDSVQATALAAKESVNSTALSSREATNAIAAALSDKIFTLSLRIDRIENSLGGKLEARRNE